MVGRISESGELGGGTMEGAFGIGCSSVTSVLPSMGSRARSSCGLTIRFMPRKVRSGTSWWVVPIMIIADLLLMLLLGGSIFSLGQNHSGRQCMVPKCERHTYTAHCRAIVRSGTHSPATDHIPNLEGRAYPEHRNIHALLSPRHYRPWASSSGVVQHRPQAVVMTNRGGCGIVAAITHPLPG
jgi:hypothetical protein